MMRSPILYAMGLFGVLLSSLALCNDVVADTLSRLRSGQVLKLGYLDGYAPFSSASAGVPEGYSIALCQAVTDRLRQLPGLADLQVQWQAVQPADVVTALQGEALDLLCTPTVETLTKRESISFSIPVFTSGLAVLVRRDAPATLLGPLSGEAAQSGPRWRATLNGGLSRHSFAVLRGSLSSLWAKARIRQLGLQSRLEEVTSYQEGVRQVVERKVDAFFGERMILLASQNRQPERDQLLIPDHLFAVSRVALAMARGDDDFRLLVDTVLSQQLAGTTGEALVTRYLGQQSAQDRLLQNLYLLPDERALLIPQAGAK